MYSYILSPILRDQESHANLSWSLRACAARGLLAVGRPGDAQELLTLDLPELWDGLEARTEPGLSDAPGQLFALRARLTDDADLATADAWNALGRDLPVFPVPAARIAIDAAHGLIRAEDPSAEDAVLEALDRSAPLRREQATP